MKVLVACEESQRVCLAFRKRGHDAYSCDIMDCSGGHPEWHIKDDVLKHLDGWDLIIAHPPCTYLTVTGNRWFNVEKYSDKEIKRIEERDVAARFFMEFVNAPCEKIAIENPIGYMSTFYRKPDQIIQPYQFGHPERKATCLWLKGLAPLIPTNIVEPDVIKLKSGKTDSRWHVESFNLPKDQRSIVCSKTFDGIAEAMAEQWGHFEGVEALEKMEYFK